MKGCTCLVAIRVNSTLATKAVAWIAAHDKRAALHLLKEANAHAESLRNQCRCYPMTRPRRAVEG